MGPRSRPTSPNSSLHQSRPAGRIGELNPLVRIPTRYFLHSTAASFRPLRQQVSAKILQGLTAQSHRWFDPNPFVATKQGSLWWSLTKPHRPG